MLVELFAAPSDTQILYLDVLQAVIATSRYFFLHMDFLAISTSDPYFYSRFGDYWKNVKFIAKYKICSLVEA